MQASNWNWNVYQMLYTASREHPKEGSASRHQPRQAVGAADTCSMLAAAACSRRKRISHDRTETCSRSRATSICSAGVRPGCSGAPFATA